MVKSLHLAGLQTFFWYIFRGNFLYRASAGGAPVLLGPGGGGAMADFFLSIALW